MTNFLIYVLAVFRLTRLLVYEDGPFDVLPRYRAFLAKHSTKNVLADMLLKLFSCKYCLGVWVAIILLYVPKVVVTGLALSGGQYLLEDYLDWRDEA